MCGGEYVVVDAEDVVDAIAAPLLGVDYEEKQREKEGADHGDAKSVDGERVVL